MFDTTVSVLVPSDLLVWQKLSVKAFLATGIAGGASDAMGQPDVDAAGRRCAPPLGQPYSADRSTLRRTRNQALERASLARSMLRPCFRPATMPQIGRLSCRCPPTIQFWLELRSAGRKRTLIRQ